MLELLASLLALGAGPAVAGLVGGHRSVLAALDGFALVAVGGLMALHVLPHAVEQAGAWAVLASVVGFVLPGLVEKRLRAAEASPGARLVLLGALGGLALHALMDGAALAGHGEGADELLALGVIFHRVPDGLAIWLIVRPWQGPRWAVGLLLLVAAATVLGFAIGENNLRALPQGALGTFQAFVAGSLLHILLHHPAGVPVEAHDDDAHHHRHDVAEAGGLQIGGALGALFAVGLLAFLEVTEAEHGDHGLGVHLIEQALATAPWIVAGIVGAGLLARWRAAGRPGGPGSGLVRGVAGSAMAGSALPTCRREAAEGAAPAATLAMLAAMPALALDGVLVSLAMLGPAVGGARVAAAVVATLAAAVAAGALARRAPAAADPHSHAHGPSGFRAGLFAATEHAIPWILVGFCLAALLGRHEVALPTLGAPASIALAAALGLTLWMSVAGLAPAVAALVAAGLAPGAAAAWLVVAPVAAWRVLRGVAALYGGRAAAAYGATVVAVAVVAGVVVQALPTTPPIAAGGPFAVACAVALGALALVALVRRGPRGLVEQVLHAPDEPVD